MDFVNGGHLFFWLYRQGLFDTALTRFYAADGVGGLSIGSALKASAPAFVPGRRPH
jgi:hypothetical protein